LSITVLLETYTFDGSHCLYSSWIVVKKDRSLISFSTTQCPLNVQQSVLLKLSARGCFRTAESYTYTDGVWISYVQMLSVH
jgi:hypothetical protein